MYQQDVDLECQATLPGQQRIPPVPAILSSHPGTTSSTSVSSHAQPVHAPVETVIGTSRPRLKGGPSPHLLAT
eukprot:1956974-Prorocentrum_lima.AAC.1